MSLDQAQRKFRFDVKFLAKDNLYSSYIEGATPPGNQLGLAIKT